MGKHKHSKDKLYVLQSELRGSNVKKTVTKSDWQSRIPFNCCCISQRPFTEPYCDENGNLYDKNSVLSKMASERASGKKEYSLDINKLIKVHFCKNGDEFICPVTRKNFNQFSKIVINKKTGNVYSSSAIMELWKHNKEMYDPLTHEPMSKSDLIILHNSARFPNERKEEGKDGNKKERKVKEVKVSNENDSLCSSYIRDSGAIQNVLQELVKQKEEKKKEELKAREIGSIQNDKNVIEEESDNELKIKCRNQSNNALAQSVTSTVCDRVYTNESLYLSERETYDLIYKEVHNSKRNCYVTLVTNLGVINLELYASIYPKLCHNFLFLCEYKYFDQTEIFKLEEQVAYFGSQRKNYHAAASGFYWRSKIKKKRLRHRIKTTKKCKDILEEDYPTNKKEKLEKEEKESQLEILKYKATLNNVKSDDDSDIDIKYIKYNDNRNMESDEPFGNLYMFRYYNGKYANMFYICLTNDYTDDNICIGRAVGGYDTLKKLRNISCSETDEDSTSYQVTETIIYTDPFKDAIKMMKEKLKREEEIENQKNMKQDSKEKEVEPIKVPTDEELVENKDDAIGKYINWDELENEQEKNSEGISRVKRVDLIKKLLGTHHGTLNKTAATDATTSPESISNQKNKKMNFIGW